MEAEPTKFADRLDMKKRRVKVRVTLRIRFEPLVEWR